MADQKTPKIIVDDDWKSQAQAEKEKLAAAEAAAAQKSAAAGGGAGPDGLPEQVAFQDLIQVLATQALLYLGAFPDPQTGRAIVALDLAKLHIDLLGVVQEKTKGNLSDDESKMLDGTAHELRLQFAEIVQAVAQAQKEGRLGKIDPNAPGGMPGGPTPGMPLR